MELPTLAGPPPALRSVIESMAALKVDQDRFSRTLLGQAFLNDWMQASNTCAFSPDTYMRRLLPFLFWEEEASPTKYSALVPVEIAIGASIKGLPHHIKEKDVPERIAQYRENKASGAAASGTYIPALGVYFAHEGKHRVAFMRHHHEPLFQAEVDNLPYPSPDRLKIVTSRACSELRYAVLDNRYLQVLLAPHTTQQILSSYGVKTTRWNQLENIPSEAGVYRAVCDRQLFASPGSRSEAARTLDLHEVLQQEEKEAQRRQAEIKRNTHWKHRLLKHLLGIPG